MFSYNCQVKQNNLIKKIKKELLNIEIMDIHARLVHIKKLLNEKKQSLESYVDKDIVNLFFDYYKSKMQFIIIPHKKNYKTN